MTQKKERKNLVLVQTTLRSYLGYAQEGEHFLEKMLGKNENKKSK